MLRSRLVHKGLDMTTTNQSVPGQHDGIVDETVERLEASGINGFKGAGALQSKEVDLSGQKVRIDRLDDFGVVKFRATIYPRPAISELEYPRKHSIGMGGPGQSEEETFNSIMKWADAVAHCYAVFDAASLALNCKPLLIEHDVTRELTRHAVSEVWETPIDEYGERGVIDELVVDEGWHAVDVTELVKTGWTVTDHPDTDTYTVERFDSTSAEYEVKVHCQFVASFKAGDRILAVYSVQEV